MKALSQINRLSAHIVQVLNYLLRAKHKKSTSNVVVNF